MKKNLYFILCCFLFTLTSCPEVPGNDPIKNDPPIIATITPSSVPVVETPSPVPATETPSPVPLAETPVPTPTTPVPVSSLDGQWQLMTVLGGDISSENLVYKFSNGSGTTFMHSEFLGNFIYIYDSGEITISDCDNCGLLSGYTFTVIMVGNSMTWFHDGIPGSGEAFIFIKIPD